MKEKILIFIPYQDTDNFYSDGIMTREYAMLYLLWEAGYKTVINVKKPRTWLDKKRYQIHNEYYPDGTKEALIKKILDESKTIQYLPMFNFHQILKRRGWWNEGYEKTISKIEIENDMEYLVYSDNPYAVELLAYLSKNGCKIFFDIMDNFAIHPSLNDKEHSVALEGYKRIFGFSNYIAANSQQTCDYMQKYSDKSIILVKNGVFANNEAKDSLSLAEVKLIRSKKANYRLCVGYIGKLGLRLDADLIDSISNACKDVLFVFVGGYLKGQINEKLIKIFDMRDNVLHLDSVPSAYVYPILDEFDVLMIPHAVGKSENGGDPLKLYQYLTRKKTIITTPILGVDEFKESLVISSNTSEWIEVMNEFSDKKKCFDDDIINKISWNKRMEIILKLI